MNDKLLRVAYVFEFLVALIAIFTAWSEIGGQAALDLMPWYYKLVFSLLLCGCIVTLTAAIVDTASLWNVRALACVTAILLLMVGMAIVTFFYAQQADAGESDETTNISASRIVAGV